MLDHEVLQAVRDGKFSVWAVGTIDEGIELLTGVRAGRERRDGSYAPDSVHGRVKARLSKLLSDNVKLRKKLSGDDEENGGRRGRPEEERVPGRRRR